jgi:hypothetical protein
MTDEQFLIAKLIGDERGFTVERSDLNHKWVDVSRPLAGKYCGAFDYESFLNFIKGWDLHCELNP